MYVCIVYDVCREPNILPTSNSTSLLPPFLPLPRSPCLLIKAALVLLANWDLVRDQSLIDSVITMVLRTDHHLAISLSHLTLTSRLQLAAAIYSRIRTPSPLRPHGVLPSVRTYMLLLSTIAVADDSETMLAFAQVLYTVRFYYMYALLPH